MPYWLVKSEPSAYSWEQLVKEGTTSWDGIRNYAARGHLNAMRKGDKVLFYHSNKGLEIVGIAMVVREAYPDPTTKEDAWVSVALKADKPLKRPVTMAGIKKNPKLKDMALLRISRLSVQPVTEGEWKEVMKMADER